MKKHIVVMSASMLIFVATEARAQSIIVTPTIGTSTREQQRTAEKSDLRDRLDERGRLDAERNRYASAFHPTDDTPESLGAFQTAIHGSACIARTVGDKVDEALEAKPMSRNEEPRMDRAFKKGKGCTKIPTTILSLQRGLLSSGSYLVHHEQAPNFPERVDPALIQQFRVHEREWNEDRVPSDRIIMDAANCLVLSDLSLADAIIRVEHGSHEEEEMMDKLFSENAQCAGGARPPNVSKTFLRSFLADALYRASVSRDTAPLFAMSS